MVPVVLAAAVGTAALLLGAVAYGAVETSSPPRAPATRVASATPRRHATSTTRPSTTTTTATTTTTVARRVAPVTTAPVRVPTSCRDIVATIAWPHGWNVVCAGARQGILGLTGPDRVTTLYVRPSESGSFLRSVALHEAGHAWDLARLDPAGIARWCARRGCNAPNFFTGGAHGSDWHEPGGAEDWAAVWNACHGGDYDRSYLGLGPPTPDECALQNELVRFGS